jgi:hypothetical protein
MDLNSEAQALFDQARSIYASAPYVPDNVPSPDYKKAVDIYLLAADKFKEANNYDQVNKCQIKIADLSALQQDYPTAIAVLIYELNNENIDHFF